MPVPAATPRPTRNWERSPGPVPGRALGARCAARIGARCQTDCCWECLPGGSLPGWLVRLVPVIPAGTPLRGLFQHAYRDCTNPPSWGTSSLTGSPGLPGQFPQAVLEPSAWPEGLLGLLPSKPFLGQRVELRAYLAFRELKTVG